METREERDKRILFYQLSLKPIGVDWGDGTFTPILDNNGNPIDKE